MSKGRKERQANAAARAMQLAIEEETAALRVELQESWSYIALLEERLARIVALASENAGPAETRAGGGGEGREKSVAVGGPDSLPSKNPEGVLTVREPSVSVSEKKVGDDDAVLVDSGADGDLSPQDNLGEGRWV